MNLEKYNVATNENLNDIFLVRKPICTSETSETIIFSIITDNF